MKDDHDPLTMFVDVIATASLSVAGWVTGAWWWWWLLAAWRLLTFRQANLTRRAAANRTSTA